LALARSWIRLSRSDSVNLLIDASFGGSIALLRSGIEPHWQPGLGHIGLDLAYAVLTEVKYRGGQHRCSVAVADAFDHVLECADTARGNNRHGHRLPDRSRKGQGVAR